MEQPSSQGYYPTEIDPLQDKEPEDYQLPVRSVEQKNHSLISSMENFDRESEHVDREVRSKANTTSPQASSILSDGVTFLHPATQSEDEMTTLVETLHMVSIGKSEESESEYMTIDNKRRDVDGPYQKLLKFNESLPPEGSQPQSTLPTSFDNHDLPQVLNESPHNPCSASALDQHGTSSPTVGLPPEVTGMTMLKKSTNSQSSLREKRNSAIDSNFDERVDGVPTWLDDTSGSLDSKSQSKGSTLVMNERPEVLTMSNQMVQCVPVFFCLETGKTYIDLYTTHTFPMHQLVEINNSNITTTTTQPGTTNTDTLKSPGQISRIGSESPTTTQPTTNNYQSLVDTQEPQQTSMINPLYEDRFEQQPPPAEGNGVVSDQTRAGGPERTVFVGELKLQRYHSFLYCTIIMTLVVGLCLDFPVLIFCFLPALWLAKKASEEKDIGRYEHTKTYGKKVLILNIVGGTVHGIILAIAIIVFFVVVFRILSIFGPPVNLSKRSLEKTITNQVEMASESESTKNHVNKENEANSTTEEPQKPINNFLSIPGVTELNRTSSLPGGIDSIDGPVQLRFQTKGSRKRAQIIRNSIAITNSDYYNEFRPQVFRRHSHRSTTGPNVPSLDTISEYEMKAYGRRPRPASAAVISPLVISNENADPNMFQYTPTPILDPARQTVPTPLSRAGTPSIATEALKADTVSVQRNSSFRTITPNDNTPVMSRRPASVLFEDEPPVGDSAEPKIAFSSDNENQFLPLYMNQESGRIYMFEDGYYIPVPPQQLGDLIEGTKDVVKQPPAPDRRIKAELSPSHSQRTQRPRSILIEPPSDYLRFVQVLMVLFLVFLDLPVLLLCSLPALICSLKVRKSNQNGHLIQAKKQSEYVLCFIVLGIIFHILLVLSFIMVFLLLHFVGGVF